MFAPLTRKIRVLASTLGVSARSESLIRTVTTARAGVSKAIKNSHSHVESLEGRTLMSTYYVSPGGNDGSSGTSQNAPWRTLSKVDGVGFKAGDTVLFQGGQTFNGGIYARGRDAGVTFGSYGSGRATIRSGSRSGLLISNTSNVTVQNLNFVGSGGGNGVEFLNDSRSTTYSGITVNSVDVSGYGADGILFMGGWHGFSNVNVSNASVHNNGNNGFEALSWHINHANFHIANSTAYFNKGNGFVLSNVNGAVLEHSVSYSNGSTIGAVGFMAYSSNNITFQYDEAYKNVGIKVDGGGFDFDWGTNNSVMQYNYSHDNDGHGLQLNQIANGTQCSNDTIRYNISVNNAQRHDYGGIGVWGKVVNSSVYNNTIIVSPSRVGGKPSGIKVHNGAVESTFVSNLTIANNIVITSGGVPAVKVPYAELRGAKGLVFRGNDYWAASGTLNFSYGGSSYSSLASWQQYRGQEMMNGKKVALNVDPKLVGGSVAYGALPSGSAAQPAGLLLYKLASNSPLINHGLNLAILAGINPGTHDYFGDPLPQGSAYDIGADEFKLR